MPVWCVKKQSRGIEGNKAVPMKRNYWSLITEMRLLRSWGLELQRRGEVTKRT